MRDDSAEKPLSSHDLQALAAFGGVASFVRFSEDAARDAGLTPNSTSC